MRLTPTWRLSSTALTRRLPSSTGCTPERKARANSPSTAPSRRRSKSRRRPIPGLSPPGQATTRSAPGSLGLYAGHPYHLVRRRAGNYCRGRHWYATPQISDQSGRVQPAATYPPWPRNPVPASGSRHPCCTTGTKLVASRGTAGRIAGMAAATIRCRSSGEWRNWQTRRIQVPVSARTWGFKSPFAHFDGAPPRRGFGLCRRWRSPMTAGQPEQLVLRAPRLLDGSGGQPLLEAALWLDGGRVAWAGPAAALPAGAGGARTIELPGGTTLVRDLGAPGGEVIALSRAIEAGTVEGPTVIAAGPAVTMTGGHIAYMGRVADGPEQMRAAVRANLALGAGCIK